MSRVRRIGIFRHVQSNVSNCLLPTVGYLSGWGSFSMQVLNSYIHQHFIRDKLVFFRNHQNKSLFIPDNCAMLGLPPGACLWIRCHRRVEKVWLKLKRPQLLIIWEAGHLPIGELENGWHMHNCWWKWGRLIWNCFGKKFCLLLGIGNYLAILVCKNEIRSYLLSCYCWHVSRITTTIRPRPLLVCLSCVNCGSRLALEIPSVSKV